MTPNELNVPEGLFVSSFSAGKRRVRRPHLAWTGCCKRRSPKCWN